MPNRPGEVRDAIIAFFDSHRGEASVEQIRSSVNDQLGRDVPSSSVRSYLGLNARNGTFIRTSRGKYRMGRRR